MSVKALLIFICFSISTLVFGSDYELVKLSVQLKKIGVNVPSNKALNKSIHIQENGESCLLALKHKGRGLKETINKNMNIKELFNVLSVQRNRSLCFESQLIKWSKEHYEADRLLGSCILNHDDWKTFNINKATDLKTIAQDNASLGPELSQWNTRGIDFIQDFYGAEAYQVRVAEDKAYSKKKAQQKIKVKSLALSKVKAFKLAVSAVAVNCSNYSQYMESTLTRQVRRLAGAEYLDSVGGDSSAHYQIIINQLSLNKGGPLPLLQQQGCFKTL
ncbi:MAG: hypothetical protein ACJAXH_000514 [Colwellia sp.]|jgi:hypothetical protein